MVLDRAQQVGLRTAEVMVGLALLGGQAQSTVSAPASVCVSLDGEARDVIVELLESDFPPPNTPMCGTRVRTSPVLRRHTEQVVACLLAIHRRGLVGTRLWRQPYGPPDARRWANGMIESFDSILAIRLYAERAAKTSDRWEQLELAVRRLDLGDASAAPAILSIVRGVEPASLLAHGRETMAFSRVQNAIASLVRRDNRDALPVLEAIRTSAGDDRPYLDVWIAQLERDLPKLEQLARRRESSASLARESLARIGAWPVLRRLAVDPTLHGRESAQWLIDNGPPRSPSLIDAASPCRRLDANGRRELEGWVLETFPPPGHRDFDCGQPWRPLGLIGQAALSTACLEDLFRHGLAGSGFWDRRDVEPYVRTQVLALLGAVDPAHAARLWAEWRDAQPRSVLQRATADVNRAQLNDLGSVRGLIEFLQHVPDARLEREELLRGLVRSAAWELIRLDHRPSRSLLERWRARGFLQGVGFETGIAQLARDAPTLERLARESHNTLAITSLGVIGATETLRRLAADPSFEYRGHAADALQSRRSSHAIRDREVAP